MLVICIPFTSFNPSSGPGRREEGRGKGEGGCALLLCFLNAVEAEMLKSGLERWRDGPGKRARRPFAELQGVGQVESGEAAPAASGGRVAKGSGPERHGRTGRSRSGGGRGSLSARPSLSQSSLAVYGVRLLRSCLVRVVPTVLPGFGGLGGRKGEVRRIVTRKNSEEGGKSCRLP